MNPRFPRMGSDDIVRLLHKNGFQDVRQKGSHLTLFNPQNKKHITVPLGKKDLPIGTAKSIIRIAEIIID